MMNSNLTWKKEDNVENRRTWFLNHKWKRKWINCNQIYLNLHWELNKVHPSVKSQKLLNLIIYRNLHIINKLMILDRNGSIRAAIKSISLMPRIISWIILKVKVLIMSLIHLIPKFWPNIQIRTKLINWLIVRKIRLLIYLNFKPRNLAKFSKEV